MGRAKIIFLSRCCPRDGCPAGIVHREGGHRAATTVAPSAVGIVKFDHDRGLYTTPFDLALSTDTDGASIRYTTDGSVPTITAGTLYTAPIHITTTTVLRAMQSWMNPRGGAMR